ncbi:PaaX family transcriptional regulator C-terminal domain-containing protein [Gordonia sinesedis]
MTSALVPPVSARSAILSLLLGAHPPELTTAEIVAAMGLVGKPESTVRVALSRMANGDDLVRTETGYRLSDRLVARQRAVEPPAQRRWRGTWEMAIVTTTGRSAADRTALRAEMMRLRMAELREGVWIRPANLARDWPEHLRAVTTRFEATPADDSTELARRLWDLDEWAERAHWYLDALAAAADDQPTRFVTMVAAVRHLQTDPLLPAELLPADWPGDSLTTVYADYRRWLRDMRPS